MPGGSFHPSIPFAPVRNLATAASDLVGVCAANVYATWTAWNARSVVVDYLDDVPVSPTRTCTPPTT